MESNYRYAIGKTVGGKKAGEKAPNLAPDVRVVQILLRDAGFYKNKVDGLCGAKTVEAIYGFQKGILKHPDGRVDPGGSTLRKLLATSGSMPRTKKYEYKYSSKFYERQDGVQLDFKLHWNCLMLCNYLIENRLVDGNIIFTSGVRSRKKAHKWSTAYKIRKGQISLGQLQALSDGKDLDGNVWYRKAWESGMKKDKAGKFSSGDQKALMDKAKSLARTYWKGSLAAEGYQLSDPRIKPNTHSKVSNHCVGNAIDIAIPWKRGAKVGDLTVTTGQNNDVAANKIVADFGLCRPIRSERWHFQLSDQSEVVTPMLYEEPQNYHQSNSYEETMLA